MYNKLLYATISSRGKEAVRRLSHRLSSKPLAVSFKCSDSRRLVGVVTAGARVLHKPAREVYPGEIGSARVDKVIDDMVKVMRKRRAVGLAAPQIGVPLRIIVLEDTKLRIALSPKEQDRRPFDLLVCQSTFKPCNFILNPKLKEKINKKALFFEGCVSVPGYEAMVERFLEVEVTGLDQDGQPIKVDASGCQARILQHECDHLDVILFVDKMEKRTFRTIGNHKLPLAKGCPQQGVR
ncbi:peptide deformylase 1A [Tanacetum coccineum]